MIQQEETEQEIGVGVTVWLIRRVLFKYSYASTDVEGTYLLGLG
jgi:hypothetical protein